jgi:hypothetical protein
MTARTIPPIVSKRNHFTPADELVENAVGFLPDQYKHENFRGWLTRYTETVIKSVASHFGLAAQRGIEQAANLLCDTEFYQVRRQQRAKWRQQMQEQEAAQKWDRMERQTCPTAEQIAEDIKWLERRVSDDQSEIARCEKRLAELRTMTPKNIRLVAPKTQ